MSLLGKILAGLNVLAALAFIALAAADYGKRQQGTHAVFRADLYLAGLPVDDDETGTDGLPIVNTLSDRTAQELFEKAGGQPVKTQVAEVQRLKAQLRQQIDADATEDGKRARLRAVLVPLAHDSLERAALSQQVATGKLDELLGPNGPFERAFDTALQKKDKQGKDRDPALRKQAVADLLFGITSVAASTNPPDMGGLTRTQVVVGLEHFITAVDHQTAALRQMYPAVQQAIATDESNYVKEHRRIIRELEILAERVREADTQLDEQQDLVKRHTSLVEGRKKGIEDINKDIEERRLATKKELEALAKDQQQVLDLQRRMQRALENNVKLEKEIVNAEKTQR